MSKQPDDPNLDPELWAASRSRPRPPMPPGEKPEVDAPNLLRYSPPPTGAKTDKLLADEFYRRYKHLFCNGDGVPHVYLPVSARWTQDDVKGTVEAYAKQTSDALYDELAELKRKQQEAVAADDEVQRNRVGNRQSGILKLILHVEKAGVIAGIARLAWNQIKQVLKDAPVQPMDPDPYSLACANGVVDLHTGELRWPTPEDYLTRDTGVVYRPDADCSEWQRVVLGVFGGDTEMADYIQRVCGYMATGLMKEQCVFVLQGLGDNGKNLIADAVKAALGGYALTVDTATFNDDASDNNVSYHKAKLTGKRFGVSSELKDQVKLNEAFVKSVTGDHMISARRPYGQPFEFKQVVKIMILTNPKPIIRGTDDGIWRRIRLVEFKVRFGSQAEVDAGVAHALKDVGLLTHFTTGDGREQVLRWVVDGARAYLSGGMRTPLSVLNDTDRYRRDEDYLGDFLNEVCEPLTQQRIDVFKEREKRIQDVPEDEWLYVGKEVLYDAYLAWCSQRGHGALNASKFKVRVLLTRRWVERDTGHTWLPRLEAHVVWRTNGKHHKYRYAKLNARGKKLMERRTGPPDNTDDPAM